ncbi:predicted protein, partial [Micromonas commoda]
YQHLIDRGWRRSGNWMYQPVLDRTCCPPYTIRLDVHRFAPTKSQKKVERRLRAYLEGRIDEKGAPTNDDARDQPSTAVKTLTVTTRPSAFDEEEYRLWRRYQTRVHGDDPNENNELGYGRFLVDTPLRRRWVASPPSGFGSFHQQYRIDGKLVAVGVVDVLPYCLSSKYFFWDPDYAALSLGKLGVLREIEWVREASAHCPTLRYYYMGYYIHDCPKMRYKGEYKPSELRCAATGAWCDLD